MPSIRRKWTQMRREEAALGKRSFQESSRKHFKKAVISEII
jgi:hypothetical protein